MKKSTNNLISSEKEKNLDVLNLSNSLFRDLDEREKDILGRRFGLSGQEPETLEKIGSFYHLTRERVRQIQTKLLESLRNSSYLFSLIAPLERKAVNILREYGGMMEEKKLLQNVLEFSFSQEESVSSNFFRKQMEFFLLFILEQLLAPSPSEIDKIEASSKYHSAWKLKEASFELLEKVIQEIKEILSFQKEAIEEATLLQLFKEQKIYYNNKERLSDQVLLSYLGISREIKRNPYEDWGLIWWPEISPSRIRDKIYLVLKKEAQPLHFTEITRVINVKYSAARKAHAPTVHNELISDSRYVLVGRGIYALREQGYKPGIVAQIVEDVFKEAKHPLSQEEILEQVSKQRLVRKETILLALRDKARFRKLGDGRYELRIKN